MARILILLSSLVSIAYGVRVVSEPNKIYLGVPGPLVINCTTSDWSDNKRVTLDSITLLTATVGGGRDFDEVVTLTANGTVGLVSQDVQASAEGFIGIEESWLSLTFQNPSHNDARMYICMVKGLYRNGDVVLRENSIVTEINADYLSKVVEDLQTRSENLQRQSQDNSEGIKSLAAQESELAAQIEEAKQAINVSLNGLKNLVESFNAMQSSDIATTERIDASLKSVNEAVERLESAQEVAKNSYTQQLTDLATRVASLQAAQDALTKQDEDFRMRFDRSAAAGFEISGVFDGRRYLLSRRSGDNTYNTAKRLCALYGGYLTELSSSQELSFIRGFINSYTDFGTVLIDGSDTRTGKWESTRTNQPLAYYEWAQGQPDKWGSNPHCLVLWRDQSWKMDDTDCLQNSVSARFLCEVPQ
ncbi:uncharacterized protein LOC131947259 [Physella acuta]|uniref:uncharacterized protein LOC131947259 n=1 Tax=Physella acuta TaxID=109671 RepID=UPI0027DDC173|nr:uncharacterized protein LOC131947259 [Physella acuta]